jgi:dihydrofolate reductase
MKIVLMAAISADGKIARSPDEVSTDWTSGADTKFFVEKTKEIGTVVFGRKTFETLNRALPDRRTIVMTRNPDAYEVEGVEFVNETPAELVARLRDEKVDELVVAGGAGVYSQFLDAELVDEVFLTVEPIVFGRGVDVCSMDSSLDLKIENVRRLGQSSVLLHYFIQR